MVSHFPSHLRAERELSSSLLQEGPRPGTPPWTRAYQSKGIEVGGSALFQHFSKRGLRSCSHSISWELVRNADSRPHPDLQPPNQISSGGTQESAFYKSFSDAYEHLKMTALHCFSTKI